jgi:type II restriction/modification system DNA methylase subunit YeeA
MLLDLWKEVAVFAGTLGLPLMLPLPGFAPAPEQLYGIELNEYAYELAQATVWIGYIQWLHENGYGVPSEPILKPLDNIKHMDAILAYDADGKPVEPEWPVADVIIGNPPFLGGKRLRTELGSDYVDQIFALYKDKIPHQADLVAYWFERARAMLTTHSNIRVGLLATQSIRAGANREVLQKIVDTGNIFMAWSDRPWILNGASVRVSIVGFDNGNENMRSLDGNLVDAIHANLGAGIDITQARRLQENMGITYQGTIKVGAFDIDQGQAALFLRQTGNPNGRPNNDVVKPWANASDITDRWQNKWIIDFGTNISLDDAANYELPFEYVRTHVKPQREKVRRKNHRERWWIFGEARPGLRAAIASFDRYIVTPRVAKHRLFTFLPVNVIPDARLYVFARQDYYFFGVLHSSIHESWSLATSSRHGVGNDPTYNNTTCFETFPFPWIPGQEPAEDLHVQAVAQAAKELVEKRDSWLNPPGLSDAELKKRTLTNLYNQRPTWLDLAHKKLDKAVFAAYGWSDLITDGGINEDEVLARLLALNLVRAEGQPEVQPALIDDDTDDDE